ncbi:MAG: hypothetical protein WCI74_06160 [Actinomycetes bacterium]
MNSRTKAILVTVITVVVLAAVFFVGWSLSSSKKSTVPPVIQLSKQQESQQAYTQGMQALSSEDTKTAAALFQKAVTLEPGNSAAKQALDQLTKSSSGSTTSGSGSSTTSKPSTTTTPKPAGGDPFTDKVADIRKLLPKSFTSYSLGAMQAIGGATAADAVVDGGPSAQGLKASNIVWQVSDRKTPAVAQEYIAKVSKAQYASDSSTVNIGGYTGYFGTDGTRFATVTVVRGRYVFSVILTAASGVTPAELKDLAILAADAFPKTP